MVVLIALVSVRCWSDHCMSLNLIPSNYCFASQGTPGYTGLFCQRTINPCANLSLCNGNGYCVPTQSYDSYTCNCFPGFQGTFCENQINYCNSLPCFNQGICFPLVNGFVCNCKTGEWSFWQTPSIQTNFTNNIRQSKTDLLLSGFQGSTCQNQTNFCENNPCSPNGQCVSIPNDYYCNVSTQLVKLYKKTSIMLFEECVKFVWCFTGVKHLGTCNLSGLWLLAEPNDQNWSAGICSQVICRNDYDSLSFAL